MMMGPYETETGFALTSNGAIGFAQEIENKLALASAVTQAAAATAAAATASSQVAAVEQKDSKVVQSNRDAYSRMHITCEAIGGGDSGKQKMDLAHDHDKDAFHNALGLDEKDDMEHTGAGLFDSYSGRSMVETGASARSRKAFAISRNKDKLHDRVLVKRASEIIKQFHITKAYMEWQKLQGTFVEKMLPVDPFRVMHAVSSGEEGKDLSEEVKRNMKNSGKMLDVEWKFFLASLDDSIRSKMLISKQGLWGMLKNWEKTHPTQAKKSEGLLEAVCRSYDSLRKYVIYQQKLLGDFTGIGHKDVPEFFTPELKTKLDRFNEEYRAKRMEEMASKKKPGNKHEHENTKDKAHSDGVKAVAAAAGKIADAAKTMAENISKVSGQKKPKDPMPPKTSALAAAPKKPMAAAAAGQSSKMQMTQPAAAPGSKAPFRGGKHEQDFCMCAQPIPVPIKQAKDFCMCAQPIPVPVTGTPAPYPVATGGPLGFISKKAAKKMRRNMKQMQAIGWQPVPMTHAPYGYAPVMTGAPAPYAYAPVMYQ